MGPSLDWYETVFEVIDMRSFSNLWYWIGIAVLWSSMSHWVLGVPFDIIQRARSDGGDAMVDLHDAVRLNVNRILYISKVSGVLLMLFGSMALTALSIVAFVYWIEFAQALALMLIPLTLIGFLSVHTARKIRDREIRDQDLLKTLARHRLATQLIGFTAIFVTAMFGMWQNLDIGPLSL